MAWSVKVTGEHAAWSTALITDDLPAAVQAAQAAAAPREQGPAPGRPPADRIQGSRIHRLKESRPGPAARPGIRALVASAPARSALLLPGGGKAGNWQRRYQGEHPDRRAVVPGIHRTGTGAARHA